MASNNRNTSRGGGVGVTGGVDVVTILPTSVLVILVLVRLVSGNYCGNSSNNWKSGKVVTIAIVVIAIIVIVVIVVKVAIVVIV